MLRTKPWPKTPPGNFPQSSFSSAWRNRELMRVDLLSSSMETSRMSRSRFRRSPKFPLAMNPNLSLANRGGRARGRRGVPQRTIGGGRSGVKRTLDAGDVPRIRELMKKYANRPMDLADAALLRVAEREGIGKIFTVDRRDFSVYRLHGRTRMSLIP